MTTTSLPKVNLGSGLNRSHPIQGKLFYYHGDELSAPGEDVAKAYAKNLPLNQGMPGPSFTWSTFASSAIEGVDVLKSDRIAPIILERLDESLVTAAHHMGWSVADMVVVMPRKVQTCS
jgi:hypothetical protein